MYLFYNFCILVLAYIVGCFSALDLHHFCLRAVSFARWRCYVQCHCNHRASIAFLTCITLKFIVICSYSKLLLYIFSELYTARRTLVTCTSSTNPASENQFQYQNLFTEPDTEPDSNPASEIQFHFQNLLQNRYYIITFKSKRPAVRSDGPLPLVLR
jgi:hypothetical protein